MACRGCDKSRKKSMATLDNPKATSCGLAKAIGVAVTLLAEYKDNPAVLPRVFSSLAQARRFTYGDKLLQQKIVEAMYKLRNKEVPELGEILKIVTEKQANAGATHITRASDLDTVERHIGTAIVLYEAPSNQINRLRILGHLYEAEDLSQSWVALNTEITTIRKIYQKNSDDKLDFSAIILALNDIKVDEGKK